MTHQFTTTGTGGGCEATLGIYRGWHMVLTNDDCMGPTEDDLVAYVAVYAYDPDAYGAVGSGGPMEPVLTGTMICGPHMLAEAWDVLVHAREDDDWYECNMCADLTADPTVGEGHLCRRHCKRFAMDGWYVWHGVR